ncbi:MAG: condensation domain-containing protein, partial [Candidatus Binatia bacterium]
MAQIWRQVLGLNEIGVDDNFFDLGGHSLLAARAAARLSASLNIELPVRKLFELPTVAELANYVEQLRRVQDGVRDAPITRVKRGRDLPLSSAQQRLWFLQKLDRDSSAYHIPAAYRIYGPLKPGALEAALNQIIERHESLRTAIVESRGRPTQRILPHAHLALRLVDLTLFQAEQANAEVRRLANLDLRLSYDLAIAPLMRASLLKLSAEEHVLLLNFHHIIADASSLVYFYRELATFYEAALVGSAVSLPRLPVQFADYASWQQRWLGSAAAKAQLAYWQLQLNNPPPALDLAADYERPALPSHRGARSSKRLSLDLTRALKDLSRREGATLFMTLLAGLSILLGRLAGRDDFIIGSTIAGRTRPELEGAIGFFINALALRCDLSGSPNFTDLLKRVREACLGAYSHQDLPFDKVVEALNPERDLGRNPLFQVMLNMNEVSERALKLKDCRAEKLIQS